MNSILIYLLNKEQYNNYRIYIKDNNILYKLLDELHKNHEEVKEFTRDDFIEYALCKLPTDSEELLTLDQLRTLDVSELVLRDIVTEIQQRAKAMELALLAVDVSEGKRNYNDLLTKASELGTIEVEGEEIEFVTDDLDELYDHNVAQTGLRWRLRTLNEMLGSLRKGDFGFVFARPESGKTTFLASEISFFAGQTERPVVWFNNEEGGEKVQLRVFQAALGCTLPELWEDRQRSKDVFRERTRHNIKIIDNANMSRTEVDRICKQLQPALIVFDQLDKVKGFTSDREDLRLGSIYQWARELAKTYGPVIGVSQADGSGEGKKWLTMENVANAKTAKQAEADWILGIGKTNDNGMDYVRHLHLSKNKLAGDSDTIPELRHGRRDVKILPEIARYEDY